MQNYRSTTTKPVALKTKSEYLYSIKKLHHTKESFYINF